MQPRHCTKFVVATSADQGNLGIWDTITEKRGNTDMDSKFELAAAAMHSCVTADMKRAMPAGFRVLGLPFLQYYTTYRYVFEQKATKCTTQSCIAGCAVIQTSCLPRPPAPIFTPPRCCYTTLVKALLNRYNPLTLLITALTAGIAYILLVQYLVKVSRNRCRLNKGLDDGGGTPEEQ